MFAACSTSRSVALFGDSITAWTQAVNGSSGWAELIAKQNRSVVHANFSAGGLRTASIYAIWQQKKGSWFDIVCIQGGINDLINGVSAATAFASLELLVDEALAYGKPILWMNVLPCANHASWSSGKQVEIDVFNGLVADKVGEHPSSITLLNAHDVVANGVAPGALAASYDNGDGLHLSASGNQAVYDAFKGEFRL